MSLLLKRLSDPVFIPLSINPGLWKSVKTHNNFQDPRGHDLHRFPRQFVGPITHNNLFEDSDLCKKKENYSSEMQLPRGTCCPLPVVSRVQGQTRGYLPVQPADNSISPCCFLLPELWPEPSETMQWVAYHMSAPFHPVFWLVPFACNSPPAGSPVAVANMSPSVTDGTPVTGTTDALGLSKQACPFREKEVSAILLPATIMRNNPLIFV